MQKQCKDGAGSGAEALGGGPGRRRRPARSCGNTELTAHILNETTESYEHGNAIGVRRPPDPRYSGPMSCFVACALGCSKEPGRMIVHCICNQFGLLLLIDCNENQK